MRVVLVGAVLTVWLGLCLVGCAPGIAGESAMQFSLVNAPCFGCQWRSATKLEKRPVLSTSRRDLSIVDEAARRYGVPINIARAIVKVESGGNCRARSWAGAIGVMQVLPATARAMGVFGSLYVCENSIEAGIRYLARIVAAHGVSCAALGLYNRGEAAAPICTAYGRAVMAWAGRV